MGAVRRISRSPSGPLQSIVTIDSKTDQIAASDLTTRALKVWGATMVKIKLLAAIIIAPHTAHFRKFQIPIPKMIRGTICSIYLKPSSDRIEFEMLGS